jgi:5-(carboxyamino)imidazole ribonucleotide mutase
MLSIVQMPPGVPVATMAINGAKNAALFALSILATTDEEIRAILHDYRDRQTQYVMDNRKLVI